MIILFLLLDDISILLSFSFFRFQLVCNDSGRQSVKKWNMLSFAIAIAIAIAIAVRMLMMIVGQLSVPVATKNKHHPNESWYPWLPTVVPA